MAPAAAAEWRANWTVVVAAALGCALMAAPTASVGLFMAPLEAEFGWKRAFIASGLMFIPASSLLIAPLVGLLVDRVGPRRIALVGVVFVCLTFGLLSQTNAHPWSWWGLWAGMAILFPCIQPMVWTAAVSSLFTASRGLALAVCLTGISIPGIGLPLLGAFLIRDYGWRTAYLGLAGVLALLVIPAVFFWFTSALDRDRTRPLRHSVAEKAILPGIAPLEGLRSFRFQRLLIASCMMIAVSAVTINLIPIVVSFGHSPVAAASVAGLTGLGALVGRLLGGYLLDRIHGNVVAAVSILLPIAAILLLLFLPGSIAAAGVAGVIMGSCLGAELDAVAYLITRHFGLRSFGFLLAVSAALQSLMVAIGPVAINHVYDVSGSYAPALWGVIPCCLLSAGLFLSLGRYPYDAHPRPAGAP